MSDTARLERERLFHDNRFQDDQARQSKVNRFYKTCRLIRQQYANQLAAIVDPQVTVLEYGCGTGSVAFDLANQGASVIGIDISEVAVAQANQTAIRLGLPNATFIQMDAEHLSFSDNSFDIVCGSGILHHITVSNGLSEIFRVLKPNGSALFVEPLGHNVLINLYRSLTPAIRSADEHPLLQKDLLRMRDFFSDVSTEFYGLATLAASPFTKSSNFDNLLTFLELVDSQVLKVPILQTQAWQVLIKLSKR